MAIDFKQYWYQHPYAGETIAVAGCGPTACSDLLEIDPITTADWLQDNGWAVPYQGTIYEGISACLSAFGAEGRMIARDCDGQTASTAFDEWERIIQSGYEGVLLMHNVVSSYWTSGGHYIAIVGYEDGRYLVYDPASESRTGWHPFSHFAGNISALYTSNKRWRDDKIMFEVTQVKRGDQGNDVYLMQSVLRGRGYIDRQTRKLPVVDGSFGESTERCLIYFQTKNDLEPDGICGPQTWAKLLRR